MSNVNHPSHYNKEGSKECIDEMVALFGISNTIIFALLNSYKYMYRDGLKESNKEDREKALWYLNWVGNKLSDYDIEDYSLFRFYSMILKLYVDKYCNSIDFSE